VQRELKVSNASEGCETFLDVGLNKIGANIGRIERGLGGMGCVLDVGG